MRKIPISIGDEAPDVALGDEALETTAKRADAAGVDELDDADGVRGGMGGFGQGVGDGVEGEVGVIGWIGGVVAGVDDGDEESARVEDAGQLKHRVDVALEWKREYY